jgi:hypothetical protein
VSRDHANAVLGMPALGMTIAPLPPGGSPSSLAVISPQSRTPSATLAALLLFC